MLHGLLSDYRDVPTRVNALKEMENQADETLRTGMRRLFKSGVDYLTIIKWKEIYDLLETATDKCLDVADVIESVVLEHA